MPYIEEAKRAEMNEAITDLLLHIKTKGDLNYAICELVGRLILATGISYTNISEKIGAVHDAEQELRHRILGCYEFTKEIQNGDLESFVNLTKIIKNE